MTSRLALSPVHPSACPPARALLFPPFPHIACPVPVPTARAHCPCPVPGDRRPRPRPHQDPDPHPFEPQLTYLFLFVSVLSSSFQVIPRTSNPMYAQRQRCGGSLRSHSSHAGHGQTNPRSQSHSHSSIPPTTTHTHSQLLPHAHHAQPSQKQIQIQKQKHLNQNHNQNQNQGHIALDSTARNRSGSSGDMTLTMTMAQGEPESCARSNVRSNSLRMNRLRRNSFSSSSTGINRVGFPPGVTCGPNVSTSSSGSLANLEDESRVCLAPERSCGGSLGSSGNLLCKHIKYCCLHQQPTPTMADQPLNIAIDPNAPSTSQHQHQPHPHQQHQQQKQQKQLHQQQLQQHQLQQQQQDIDLERHLQQLRLGPDGEDNSGVRVPNNFINRPINDNTRTGQQRHSVILERAFDFGE